MNGPLAFVLNGAPISLPAGIAPAMSLLDWLRGPARLMGTKEGCAEGDCGACTVVIEETDGVRVPVNACLTLLGQLQGKAIRTVEGLRPPGGTPHPVQQGVAETDGTQCGFCTPGIVMSLWAQAREGGDPHEALAGNLCRCTGYRPILDAMEALEDDGAAPPVPMAEAATAIGMPGQAFFLPRHLDEVFALRSTHPEAWLLAGGTDLGLRVSEHRERPAAVISLRDVAEMNGVESRPEGLLLGAMVPYHRLLRLFRAEAGFAPFAALLARLGSRQIRGSGTLGGNLGTASPIGDSLPVLLALGAEILLAGPSGERGVPVEAFFLGYRKTAMEPEEVIRAVFLPRPAPYQHFDAQKLSKRHDQDIATVALASLITVKGGVITAARLALGGVAATPLRAHAAETVLLGQPWTEVSFERAAKVLAQNLSPLSDWRASAEYRRLAAGNLLRRAFWRVERPDLPGEIMAIGTAHRPGFMAEGA